MCVEPSILASVLEDELKNVVVEESGDKVVVTDSFAAGMWCLEDFEAFEKEVEQFVLQYTESWVVDSTSHNRIEGYHQAVLALEED